MARLRKIEDIAMPAFAMPRRRFLALTAAIPGAMLAAPQSALAREAQVFSSWGLAIRGYDPVAYFNQNKPVEGERRFSTEWRGATWRFASAENLAAFQASPSRYAPQYGGYCAWAVSQGYTASIDPNAWRIVNDKLYLNYSRSVAQTWAKDIPGNIAKGDANWPKVLEN